MFRVHVWTEPDWPACMYCSFILTGPDLGCIFVPLPGCYYSSRMEILRKKKEKNHHPACVNVFRQQMGIHLRSLCLPPRWWRRLHMLGQCSRPSCQIGQRALISGSLKDSASCRQLYSASDTPDSALLWLISITWETPTFLFPGPPL